MRSRLKWKTYKLLTEYCAHFDPILHMLPKLFREYRTGYAGLYSLIGVSPVCASFSCGREDTAGCTGHVQSDQVSFITGAKYS